MVAKDTRLFARFDLDYADNPKIVALSDAAFRAHVEFILYARKYKTDGVIPNRVANRVGFESLKELLSNDENNPSLVQNDDGSYTLHGYADMNETRAEIEARSRRNSRNGAHGGRPKNRVGSKTKTESVTESLSETKPTRKAETETETETEVSAKALTTRARDTDTFFESAYAAWPKKVEKKKSHAAFVKAAKTRDPETLTADIRRFGAAYAATTPKQYTPALSVWLNGERWNDELPQPRPNQQTAHDRAVQRQNNNLAVVAQMRALDEADRLRGIEA